MTSRILPPEEWSRLAGTEADAVWEQLPASACVVAVEDDGVIVGCHVLVPVLHAECLWIHPEYRKRSSVARRLWSAVQREAIDRFGAFGFQTAAVDDHIRGLLSHVGAVPLPGDHYMVPVKERH
jgi:ribosomal protein S18 acetylase RimI-like enzyme